MRRDKRQEAIAEYIAVDQWGCDDRSQMDEDQEKDLAATPTMYRSNQEEEKSSKTFHEGRT